MFIERFENFCSLGESTQVRLPRRGLILDPRVNDPPYCVFDCQYHDDRMTVTLTRIDSIPDDGGVHYLDLPIGGSFTMRVFDPATEVLPDFNSTTYVYFGIDEEIAPSNTTQVIIHPSIQTIQSDAFIGCENMRRCIMHNNVVNIGKHAFSGCEALDALFLPSSVKTIGDRAFDDCPNIRILSIPKTIDVQQMGEMIIDDCHTLFSITQRLPPYQQNRCMDMGF